MTPVGICFEKIDRGFRVKETATHYVDVLYMRHNWWVARSPKDIPSVDRAWGYLGITRDVFVDAVIAAWWWDGADDTEPEGWNKNLQTGEIRWPDRDIPGYRN